MFGEKPVAVVLLLLLLLLVSAAAFYNRERRAQEEREYIGRITNPDDPTPVRDDTLGPLRPIR